MARRGFGDSLVNATVLTLFALLVLFAFVLLYLLWALAHAAIPLFLYWIWRALRSPESTIVLPDPEAFDWTEEREKIVAARLRSEESRARVRAVYSKGDRAGLSRTKSSDRQLYDERNPLAATFNRRIRSAELDYENCSEEHFRLQMSALKLVPDLDTPKQRIISLKAAKTASGAAVITLIILANILRTSSSELLAKLTSELSSLLPVFGPIRDSSGALASAALAALAVYYMAYAIQKRRLHKNLKLRHEDDWNRIRQEITSS